MAKRSDECHEGASHGESSSAEGAGYAAASGAAADVSTSSTRWRRGAAARGADAMHFLTKEMKELNINTRVTVQLGESTSVTTTTATRLSGNGRHRKGGEAGNSGSAAAMERDDLQERNDHGQQRSVLEGGIWNYGMFQVPPKGEDKWLTDYLGEGWLVRSHGTKGRVRPFHPIHRSCPVPASSLTGRRVTLVYGFDGTREVLHDEWTIQRTWQKPGPWKGYTFMEVKSMQSTGSASINAAGAMGSQAAGCETSDEDFEVVTADDPSA